MTKSIAERLRDELGWGIGPAMLCQEAAEEIERLEKINAELTDALSGLLDAIDPKSGRVEDHDKKLAAQAALGRAKASP